MASSIDLPYPPRWINAFIFDKLCEYDDIGVSKSQKVMPIFASSPTSIEETYQKTIQSTTLNEPLLIQYDRLIKSRPNAFYPQKKDQMLYQIYSTSLANVNNATLVISQLLDREDASAQEVNAWNSNNPQKYKNKVLPYNVFFHRTRVYQIDDPKEFMRNISNNPIYVSKMVIEYDYHTESIYK